jgi:hypothetical protein
VVLQCLYISRLRLLCGIMAEGMNAFWHILWHAVAQSDAFLCNGDNRGMTSGSILSQVEALALQKWGGQEALDRQKRQLLVKRLDRAKARAGRRRACLLCAPDMCCACNSKPVLDGTETEKNAVPVTSAETSARQGSPQQEQEGFPTTASIVEAAPSTSNSKRETDAAAGRPLSSFVMERVRDVRTERPVVRISPSCFRENPPQVPVICMLFCWKGLFTRIAALRHHLRDFKHLRVEANQACHCESVLVLHRRA